MEYTQSQIQSFQVKFLNKKVLYHNPTTKVQVGGVCQFIGINPQFPHWGLQVTIDRLPVRSININHLDLQV